MSDLLDITDNSDPLNIRKGNPGLKPSFTQNLRIFYNNYTHNLELMLRIVRKTFNFNVGVRLIPQRSHFLSLLQCQHLHQRRLQPLRRLCQRRYEE